MGVRQGPWKLVVSTRYRNMNINLRAHNFYQGGILFDVQNDPAESFNVAREHPDIVQRLNELLGKGTRELNPRPGPQSPAKQSERKLPEGFRAGVPAREQLAPGIGQVSHCFFHFEKFRILRNGRGVPFSTAELRSRPAVIHISSRESSLTRFQKSFSPRH